MEHEVRGIAGSFEALIWAIGCVWTVRVERFITHPRPVLNSAMLFLGLYITVQYLLTHMVWYGMAPAHSDLDIPPRGLLKLFIFLFVGGVMAVSTPGDRPRRLFGALAFPFYGVLGLLAVALGSQVIQSLTASQGGMAQVVLYGPIFGLIVAMCLSLPCTLLYRGAAVPVAILALVPAVSKEMGLAARPALDTNTYVNLLEQLWPFICAFTILWIFCNVCRRWVSRLPGADEGP